MAVVAIGVSAFMTWHIAEVYISNPFLKSHLSKLLQCSDGRGRESRQFIMREKSQKMQRIIRAQLL
jgi:hypothetical protein